MRRLRLLLSLIPLTTACAGSSGHARPDDDPSVAWQDLVDAGPPTDANPLARQVVDPPDDAEWSEGAHFVVLRAGTGSVHPQSEDLVKVRYRGLDEDGSVSMDSQHDQVKYIGVGGRHPFLSAIERMVVGETRRIWYARDQPLHSELTAYRMVDIELLDIRPGPTPAPPDAVRGPGGLASKPLRPGVGSRRPSLRAFAEVEVLAWTPSGEAEQYDPHTELVRASDPRWSQLLPLMLVGELRRTWRGREVEDVELLGFVEPPGELGGPPDGADKLPGGVRSRRLAAGTGTVHPGATDTVEIHFNGFTRDGTLIKTSVFGGRPWRVAVDTQYGGPWSGPGWARAIRGMVVGERRRFWMPAQSWPDYRGYEQARPAVEAVFDVELVAIHPASQGR